MVLEMILSADTSQEIYLLCPRKYDNPDSVSVVSQSIFQLLLLLLLVVNERL